MQVRTLFFPLALTLAITTFPETSTNIRSAFCPCKKKWFRLCHNDRYDSHSEIRSPVSLPLSSPYKANFLQVSVLVPSPLFASSITKCTFSYCIIFSDIAFCPCSVIPNNTISKCIFFTIKKPGHFHAISFHVFFLLLIYLFNLRRQ